MKKLLLVLVLFSCVVFGQQTAIYQTLWTNNVGSTPLTLVTSNIGASTHEVLIVISGAGCVGPSLFINGLSSKSVTASSVTLNTSTSTTSIGTHLIKGNGLFPAIGVQFVDGGGNCTSTAYYYGYKGGPLDPLDINPVSILATNIWSGLQQSPSMDSGNNLYTVPYTGIVAPGNYYNFTTNGDTSFTAHFPDYIGTIVVGTAGTGSSTLSVTIDPATPVFTLDTTKTGVYNLNLVLQQTRTYHFIRAGTAAANVSIFGNFQ